jgi:hypothetical protein
MIFILFFGMTMRAFAWAIVGSLRSHLFEKSGFITQRLRKNYFFVKKNSFFFVVMQAIFYYAKLIFTVFGILFSA